MDELNQNESKGAQRDGGRLTHSLVTSFAAAAITGLILFFLVGQGDFSAARLAITVLIVIVGAALTFLILSLIHI